MKQQIIKQVVFIGKSMLWSLLLYVAMMLVIYKDEISVAVSGKQAIASAHISGNSPVSIREGSTGFTINIAAILKAIGGFGSNAAGM